MSKLEREYNNRFKNQELPNSDFETEALWGSIEDTLTEEDTSAGVVGFKWPLKTMLGIGIVGLLVLFYFVQGHIFSQDNNLREPNTSQVSILPPVTNDLNRTPTKSNTQETTKGQTFQPVKNRANTVQINKTERSAHTNINEVNQQTKKQNKSTFLDETSQRKENLKEEKTEEDSKSIIKKQKSASSPMTTREPLAAVSDISNIASANESEKDLEVKTPATNLTISSIEIENRNIESKSIDHNNQLKIDVIPTLPLGYLKIEADIIPMEKEFSKRMLKDENKIKNIWRIGGTVGANMVHFKYQSKINSLLADEKNLAEQVVMGGTYGITVDRSFRSGLIIGSGVEYNQLWSKFNIEKQRDYQLLKEDQLVKVWVNASTGDTLNILRSDTLVNARNVRNVKHYNSYQRISVPLKVGFIKQGEKWSYGLHAGLTLNFTLGQTGKSLDAGGLPVVFDSEDKLSPYKIFDVGLFVGPILGYHLNDSWTVNVAPQWRWNRNTDLGVSDLSVGIHQLNLNLGIQYSLGK